MKWNATFNIYLKAGLLFFSCTLHQNLNCLYQKLSNMKQMALLEHYHISKWKWRVGLLEGLSLALAELELLIRVITGQRIERSLQSKPQACARMFLLSCETPFLNFGQIILYLFLYFAFYWCPTTLRMKHYVKHFILSLPKIQYNVFFVSPFIFWADKFLDLIIKLAYYNIHTCISEGSCEVTAAITALP